MSIGVWIVLAVVAVAILIAGSRSVKTPTALPPQTGPVPEVEIDEDLEPFVEWLILEASEQTGMAVHADEDAVARIVEAALKAREALATQPTYHLSIPFLMSDSSDPKHFELDITREDLLEHQ